MSRNDVCGQKNQQGAAGSATSTAYTRRQHGRYRSSVGDEGMGQIVHFSHVLADHINEEKKVAAMRKTQAAMDKSRGSTAAADSQCAGEAAKGSAAAGGAAGAGGANGKERARLDTERQILLTLLLAHMCSEHDATPRTFVEQVLRLYEAEVLDSIQFLFDLGFVPRVALPFHGALDRKAMVEAVRGHMDSNGKGVGLRLETWPEGEHAAAAAAAAATTTPAHASASADAAALMEGLKPEGEEAEGATSMGLRILSTSRYLRDFQEEGMIARGSFGDVYRTRHRLDGTSYAIKKVVFRGTSVSHPRAKAVMREVQCLAQLDHRNVVRYHTSWLESTWVQNGVGHSRSQGHADFRVHAQAASAAGEQSDAGVARDRNGMLDSRTAQAIRTLAGEDAGGKEMADTPRDSSLHAQLDALVPARMQPELMKDLEGVLQSVDSCSDEGSGLGLGWRNGGDPDEACHPGAAKDRADVKGSWRKHQNGSLPRGNNLFRSRNPGDDFGSLSPSVLSPSTIRHPVPTATRDRGFSNWSAEDVESDTSKWSEASSGAVRGMDFGGSFGSGVDEGDLSPRHFDDLPLSPFGLRTAVGVAAGPSPPQHGYSHPAVLRARRAQQFRHPSIDLDDLVSFGKLAPTAEDKSGEKSAQKDAPKHDWHGVGAGATTQEAAGGGGGGRKVRGRGQVRNGIFGRRGRHGRRRAGKSLNPKSSSPDGPVHYPVTLYIQMTLCPGDTLQDWLRKRNARLSLKSQSVAGGGDTTLESAKSIRAPKVRRGREQPRHRRRASHSNISQIACADSRTISILQKPVLISHDHEGTAPLKPETVPSASSPRTDPVTSDSSGGPDESPEVASSADVTAGAKCPPPTRETSHEIRCPYPSNGVEVRSLGSSWPASKGRVSPTGSLSGASEVEGCEWKAEAGAGRVDLHEALGMFRQLLDGVAHVHSKGIIHRDIKPENVFVGEDGCLKIGDFGLSRPEAPSALSTSPPKSSSASGAEDSKNVDGVPTAIIPRVDRTNDREGHTTGVGTASYASPEQLQGRRYGLRSDLFSLGLVLLELCCCFTTTHERAAAFQAMRGADSRAPNHLAERSPVIAELASQLCRTEPELRPSASEALERVSELCAYCECPVCVGEASGGSGDGDGHESDGSADARLREELAVKTRIVEQQEALIGQLQRKLSELSRNASPAVGPVNPGDGAGGVLDMESLGLGLAALNVPNPVPSD